MSESPQLTLPLEIVETCLDTHGSPCYLYDEKVFRASAAEALSAPNAFGLSVRYAMKACPNAAVLKLFHSLGILMDASSGYEAERALAAGIPGENIQLTAQEVPRNLKGLLTQGVRFNACSLEQIRCYGEIAAGTELRFRVNPGLGTGHSNRANTGGKGSSFGIWHEYLDKVFEIANQYRLKITGLHSHVGAGTDPDVWAKCSDLTLAIAAKLPDLTWLSLGGGFKIARMSNEKQANMHAVLSAVKEKLLAFAETYNKKLWLEVEPGTFLSANAGYVLSRVIDVVDTGDGGYSYIKIDSGMTEILRPSLYGAQHPIWILSDGPVKPFLVVGHCCESGDILTPAPADPEALEPRNLPTPKIGDICIIGGAGAYCSGMAAKHYNSFPEAPEVMLTEGGKLQLIRRRGNLESILANEV